MTATRFRVPRMDCATEKEVITRRLADVDGIDRVEFDLIDRIVIVHHDAEATATSALRALREIEMEPTRLEEAAPGVRAAVAPLPVANQRRELALLAISGVTALAAEIVAWTSGREQSAIVIALAVFSIVTGGIKALRKAVVAARTLTLNINLLMLIAVVGAVVIGQWPEAAMVTFLFACAEVIEARSVDRARDAIRSLMVLAPDRTSVRRGGAWVEEDTAGITPGDTIQIRPGERVPLDGTVSAGRTSIDQAPITGESIPVGKVVGDPVFAGSVNQQGMIEVTVTAGAGDTTLARIAKTIRDAQAQQAPTERFVDMFARRYTPAVVLLAIVIAIAGPLVTGEAFTPWIYKALVLLVIACPCALVISTPVTVVSGLAAAARRGILVKGGVHLENARHVRMVAVDKTGTLTEGRPRLTDLETVSALTKDEVLMRAAALEGSSAHPLARAVTEAYAAALPAVTDVVSTDGKGIEGTVDGERIGVGSHRFAEERGVCRPEVETVLARLEADGKSVMVVWRDREALGVIGVADTVRESSVTAIAMLRRLGVTAIMLTGDNATTAAAVAAKVGVEQVRANLLPEDKVAMVEALARDHGQIAMVGDGVNDAPALARASLGFAMGAAGSDTALETADVALMSDDLRGVPTLVALSRATSTVLRTNIAFAIAVKAVFFGLGLAGIATLWMAVFADMGASLVVAANGLRLLRWRPGGSNR